MTYNFDKDKLTDVATEIVMERVSQTFQWSLQHDDEHLDDDWLHLVTQRARFDSSRSDLIKAAALIMAWVEAKDRAGAK